jgi:hypothetical protein
MFYKDDKQHHLPHIHVEYQGDIVVLDIETGGTLSGSIPTAKKKRNYSAFFKTIVIPEGLIGNPVFNFMDPQ